MSPQELEQYLHGSIPLSRAMQVAVLELSDDWVVLGAPLAPNVNHRGTAFGGSARASLTPSALWPVFLRALERRGKARISVSARLISDAQVAGHFVGEFVALAAARPNMGPHGGSDA